MAEGDRRAFDALYDRTAPRLFAVCRSVLSDQEEAEEALQEVYVKVWRHADRFDRRVGTPDAWLVSIARNAAVDRRRRQDRRDRLPGEVPPPPAPDTPEEAVIASSEASRLHACLSRLPDERATAIRRAYFTGETYAEMAEATGTPEGTLKSWVRRSLSALRRCLVDDEGSGPAANGGAGR